MGDRRGLAECLRFNAEALPRAVGVVCLALAVAVLWFPALYPGLDMK